MDSLNVKNINDEKIFNVIDPNGQGNVETRIRPISISINQKAETINNQTDSTINLAVYWNDTWKSILDLTFDESLRQEYGKLVEDLTKIQKDIDMKQYKDAETKTSDFLKYIANLSSKYTAIPEKAVVANTTNDFISIKAEKNSVTATISDTLLNFMLRKFAKVNNLDVTKANENFSTNNLSCLANHYDLYYHSPEIFQKQAYMTVVKDNKVVGSYKVNYDQFSKFASKFMLTPQKLGYSKDKMAGYIKTAEVVMQNIFFDSVDEAKEWQEMVDEKKKETAQIPEGEEETAEIKETETKTEKTIGEEGKSESPVKEDGGLARPSEDFASDEIPESQPRQQEQQGGGQDMAASRKVNNVKKVAEKQLWVEVIYGDGEKDKWVTDMNPNLTDEEVKKYFIGKTFNLENKRNKAGDPLDELVKVKDVVIHRESNKKIKLNKKALYGDVQEQDIVPAKTETKVYLQSEKAEQTVEENEILAIGDIVAIDVDTFENEKEFIQYGDYAGIPLILMEVDKENIDNVIVETVDYPYERMSIARTKIVPIGAIADEQVIVEDVDGDEMITTFEELPIVAKQCKIKSIHKAARISKNIFTVPKNGGK